MKTRRSFLIAVCLVLLATGCNDDEEPLQPRTGNMIYKFELRDHGVCGAIDHEKGQIRVQAGALVDLSSVRVGLVLSEGATVTPAGDAPVDLTVPVVYRVTSETGEARNYTVTAEQYSDTALLVVDIQNGLLPFYMSDSIICRTAKLIERARNAGKPVVFVQAVLGETQSSYGIWAFQVPDALGPSPGDLYVTKDQRDSFDNSTELVRLLNERGVGSCIITGIATHACVNGTVQGGVHRGYRIIVAADAHSSYDPGAQNRIDTYNGVVWPSMGAIVLESHAIIFDNQ